MLHVAIVEDESSQRAHIRQCLDYVAQKSGVSFSVDEYDSTTLFLMRFESQYDIVFMDIEFPSGKNGLAAAAAMRKTDASVVLIFITHMAQMAIQGYTVDALDFLVKPIDKYSFLLKMTRVLARVTQNQSRQIAIKTDGEIRSLRVNMIRYLTVDGHYVVYHSREGVFSEYITLSAAEEKIGATQFSRCDRGCSVNLRFVSEIRKDTCIVDGDELPIARSRRCQFIQAYADYLGGLRGGL